MKMAKATIEAHCGPSRTKNERLRHLLHLFWLTWCGYGRIYLKLFILFFLGTHDPNIVTTSCGSSLCDEVTFPFSWTRGLKLISMNSGRVHRPTNSRTVSDVSHLVVIYEQCFEQRKRWDGHGLRHQSKFLY